MRCVEILEVKERGKRNIVVVECRYMCKKSGEFVDHLLLHGKVAGKLWNYIFTLFGIEWVMPRQVMDLLTSWGGLIGSGLVKEL